MFCHRGKCSETQATVYHYFCVVPSFYSCSLEYALLLINSKPSLVKIAVNKQCLVKLVCTKKRWQHCTVCVWSIAGSMWSHFALISFFSFQFGLPKQPTLNKQAVVLEFERGWCSVCVCVCVCVFVHISSCSLFVYCSSYSMHACMHLQRITCYDLAFEAFQKISSFFLLYCVHRSRIQIELFVTGFFYPTGWSNIQNKTNPKNFLSLFVLVLP